jgi:hypothetical protein
MVDQISDRENEMQTYLRNQITDPNGRGTSVTDTFAPTAGQTVLTLTNSLVKNVTLVDINSGTTRYIGHHYTIQYGEGTALTTVTFRTAFAGDETVNITYKYGESMIYAGFQRLDSELPRISIIPGNVTPQFMSLGEDMDGSGGRYAYYDCSYIAEIRSRFAKQLKTVTDDFANKLQAYRQQTPQVYRMIILTVSSIARQDYDNELRVYRAQVYFTVRWIHQFK